MPLASGTTLGPYTVTAKIGEGGMGEVYRAKDTKLDRDVALKVLPEAFTADPTLATSIVRRTRSTMRTTPGSPSSQHWLIGMIMDKGADGSDAIAWILSVCGALLRTCRCPLWHSAVSLASFRCDQASTDGSPTAEA